MSTPKAVIYCRVSTEEQAENGTSIRTQEDACRRNATERCAEVVAVHRDEGVSGGLYLTRPGIQAALADIDAGRAEFLIVYSISRLSREVEHQQIIKKRAERAGGRVIVCDMPIEDTEEGDLMYGVSGTFAQYERRLIRKRTMKGKRERAKDGIQPARSRSPFGFHVVTKDDVLSGRYRDVSVGTYVVLDDQAYWVREVFARFDAGWSLARTARWLEEQGAPTPKGGRRWYPTSVRSILDNSAYVGRAIYGRKETVSGENLPSRRDPTRTITCGRYYKRTAPESWTSISCPSIVAVDLWDRCQVRLAMNKQEKEVLLGGNPDRRFLLSGLIRCPSCGWRMGGTRKKSWGGVRLSYYKCDQNHDCDRRYANYPSEIPESLAVESLRYLLQHPDELADALRAYDEKQRRDAERSATPLEAEKLRTRLDELAAELDATKKMVVAAIRAGLREEDFADDLQKLAQERKGVEARLDKLLPQRDNRKTLVPEDTAAKTAKLAEAIVTVFAAPDELCSRSEKRTALAGFIDRITPTDDDGIEVLFRDETLQFVKMKAYVSVTGPAVEFAHR